MKPIPPLIIAGLLLAVTRLAAQLPTADLTRISPPACRAGSDVQITLYGDNLDDLTGLSFTHPGISAAAVKQADWEFLKRPSTVDRQFQVTVAKDVPPGIYEVRSLGHFGASTARAFVVAPADAVEITESGDHSEREQAMTLAIGATVTGAGASRGVDWYRFSAQAGQRLLIQCLAERIDSRMDGMLVLYDANGVELDRNRQHFGRDPFLDFTADTDGDYFVAVSDVLYDGSADHFYRLQISTAPQIDFIFPPAGLPGQKARFTLYGRNLPGGSLGQGSTLAGRPLETVDVEITLPAEVQTPGVHHPGQPRQGMLRGFDYSYEGSNPWRIGFATAPVVLEKAKVDVQSIKVPAEVAGRFDEANDEDRYRFIARKGITYWIEAISDQMSVTADPAVTVYRITKSKDGKEARKQVATNDDPPSFFGTDNLDTINFDTVDAVTSFTADADAEYEVEIIDQYGSGGVAQLYRLAIREAAPDFDLLASTERPVPTNRTGFSVTPLLRRNARWAIRIIAPRRDGFTGDITIRANGLPPGVTSEPLVLSGPVDHGMLVLAADEGATNWAGNIDIVGTAQIGDRTVTRSARFTTLVWGFIFADSIRVRSRLTQRVPLGVNGQEEAAVIIRPEKRSFTVTLGEKLEIPVKVVDNGTRKGNLTITPDGLFGIVRRPPSVNVAEGKSEGKLTIEFEPNGNFKAEPGTYQFPLMGIGVSKYRANAAAADRLAADEKQLTAIVEQLEKDSAGAKKAADQKQATYETARDNAATATGEKKKRLAAKVEESKNAFEAAAEIAKELAEKLDHATKEHAAIKKLAEAATKRATESNTKFAAWSDPITVVVKPQPAK